MSQPIIIGLAGKRGVGKSEVAGFLTELGFIRVHAFDGGKAAVKAYYQHIGIAEDMAWRMVYSDLKDKPCDLLPSNATSRFFMERFGRFMGVEMGAEWTLGLEIKRLRRLYPRANLVVESIVYEDKELRAAGGYIVRVERPGFEGPVGMKSDEYESQIAVDATITNSGTLVDLSFQTGKMIGSFT
jgi:hypothetical protein